VKSLAKAVKDAKALGAKVKADLETDVKILKLELSKQAPNLAVVRVIGDALRVRAGEIGDVAAKMIAKARETVGAGRE
jgi:hypothetical protein